MNSPAQPEMAVPIVRYGVICAQRRWSHLLCAATCEASVPDERSSLAQQAVARAAECA
jgi:hypothetical protein